MPYVIIVVNTRPACFATSSFVTIFAVDKEERLKINQTTGNAGSRNTYNYEKER